MCTCDGGIFRADVFRLQPVATDSKKTMHSVSTVLVGDGCCASVSVHVPVCAHACTCVCDLGSLLVLVDGFGCVCVWEIVV